MDTVETSAYPQKFLWTLWISLESFGVIRVVLEGLVAYEAVPIYFVDQNGSFMGSVENRTKKNRCCSLVRPTSKTVKDHFNFRNYLQENTLTCKMHNPISEKMHFKSASFVGYSNPILQRNSAEKFWQGSKSHWWRRIKLRSSKRLPQAVHWNSKGF